MKLETEIITEKCQFCLRVGCNEHSENDLIIKDECNHKNYELSHHRRFGWLKWCLTCKDQIFWDNNTYYYKMYQVPRSIREKSRNQTHIQEMIKLGY